MSAWKNLALALLLVVPATARAESELENGGTIIFHSHYTVDSAPGQCSAFVIVTSKQEIANLTRKIRAAEDELYFRMEGSTEDMTLHPISHGRLSGRFVASQRRVMVVSQEYADKHGFLP